MIQYQILWTNIIRIVQQIARRITNLILGVKGLLRPNCTLLSSITIISEPYLYWYLPNYTQNYVITYTNCTLLSSITIILDAKIIRSVEGWIKVLGDIFWAEVKVSEICWFFCLRITLLPADGIPELKHKSVLFMCESPCWEPTKDHE